MALVVVVLNNMGFCKLLSVQKNTFASVQNCLKEGSANVIVTLGSHHMNKEILCYCMCVESAFL